MDRFVSLLGAIFLVVTLEQVSGHLRHDPLGCHNGTKATVDECCTIPVLADKAILEKCKSEHPFMPPNKDTKGKGSHPGCIAECVLKGMGAMKNDLVDVAGFNKAIQPVVKANPDFAKLIEDAVKTCEKRSNMDVGFSKSPDNTASNSVAKVFVNCVYGTLFEQCPTKAWTKKDECTLLKEKIKMGCPYFALRKHNDQRKRPT